MKKTILLLALLLSASTLSFAQSTQCTGIALSTGIQCEKKVALKHNRTTCHHHIDTDYTEQEDIDFLHAWEIAELKRTLSPEDWEKTNLQQYLEKDNPKDFGYYFSCAFAFLFYGGLAYICIKPI